MKLKLHIFAKIDVRPLMMKKRRCNSDQTLIVNNIKIYRWYIKAMDCLISLLLVSDLSQKHEHKKSLIIPGEQGRAGDVPYTIVKRKNRFFMLTHFHLQPAATALTIDEFRKLIFIILRKKNCRDNVCVSRFLWCFLVTKKIKGQFFKLEQRSSVENHPLAQLFIPTMMNEIIVWTPYFCK